MANHVIRDRIWESRKLRECSRDAALAYPWVYLVADPWGRFECNPARIWALVFGCRKDISTDEVASWLAEYERVGLLFRYHVDNELGFWTGFYSRSKSLRKPSQYPDPEPFMRSGRKKSAKLRPETSGRKNGAKTPRELDRELDRDMEREGIATTAFLSAYNETFGTSIGATDTNRKAVAQAVAAGLTVDGARKVFEAVRDKKPGTATWCHENNRAFHYLIRPTYTREGRIITGAWERILPSLSEAPASLGVPLKGPWERDGTEG